MDLKLRDYARSVWMMEGNSFNYWRDVVKESVRSGKSTTLFDESKDEKSTRVIHASTGKDINTGVESRLYIGRPEYIKASWRGDNFKSGEDQIVNIIFATGPITRDYNCDNIGSQRMRDDIISAANDNDCVGTILFIDTPGGAADCMPDMEQAINYSRSLGKEVVAFVDGDANSLGYGFLSLCKEAYYTNAENRIGCIGTMCNYSTIADKEKNSFTGETNHYLVGKDCPDKNSMWRKSAEGDDSEVQAMVDDYAASFIATILASRPSVKPEQTTGKVYRAGDVVGEMIDGESTLENVALRVVELCNPKKKKSSSSATSASGAAPTGVQNNCNEGAPCSTGSASPLSGDTEGAPHSTDGARPVSTSPVNIVTNTTTNMNLDQILATLEIDELAITDGGSFLNAEQLEAINTAIGARSPQDSAEIDNLNASLATANDAIAERDNTITELNGTIETLNGTITERDAAIAANEQTITENNDTIARLNSEIAQLAGDGPEVEEQEQPETNNTVQPDPNAQSVIKQGMTLEEEAAAVKARKQARESKGF